VAHRLNVLVPAEEIAARVAELGREISEAYRNRQLICVCVLKGAFLFFADLLRHVDVGPEIDFVRLASYGAGTASSGTLTFSKDLEVNIEGKHVLIVEDIVDSGRSVEFLEHVFSKRNPRSLKICALVDKKERRETDVPIAFTGFNLTGKGFLVGFGMDYAERYRELDAIYELIREG
jgi:hypoxanthine phosphoribosyltransferase